MYVWVWVYAQECSACRDQKRATDPLELELQPVASFLTGALATKLCPLQEQYMLLSTEPPFQLWPMASPLNWSDAINTKSIVEMGRYWREGNWDWIWSKHIICLNKILKQQQPQQRPSRRVVGLDSWMTPAHLAWGLTCDVFRLGIGPKSSFGHMCLNFNSVKTDLPLRSVKLWDKVFI